MSSIHDLSTGSIISGMQQRGDTIPGEYGLIDLSEQRWKKSFLTIAIANDALNCFTVIFIGAWGPDVKNRTIFQVALQDN